MIKAQNIIKTFTDGVPVTVLKGIDLEIPDGEFVAIIGPSGAGKSTLLYQLSLLDTPTSGSLKLGTTAVESLDDTARIGFRLNNFGFVFQEHALLPELTALENVALPLLMLGIKKKQAYQRAEKALGEVDLAHRMNNLPSQLSGGEKQRVAIARAVINEPEIVFADEPTASLDSERSADVMQVLVDMNKKGQTIVMVTHEMEWANLTDRIIKIADGKVAEDIRVTKKQA